MTASLPLREPFFLRGRKSVLQRAIIMSCVLGGLTAAAGWISAIAEVALFQLTAPIPIPLLVICLAAAILVHGPLHWWNRRSWLWTLAAVPICLLLLLLLSAWLRLGRDALGARSRELIVNLGILGVIAGSGLLQIRFRRLHLLAYVVSLLGVLLPAAVPVILPDPSALALPGFTNEMVRGLALAILYGSCFGALSLPWGIPFWWPPADDESSRAPNPQLLPDLLDS